MSVTKCPLPKISALHAKAHGDDFMDCYAAPSNLTPVEASRIGFMFPVWAKALLALRNKIVTPLGLKTELEDSADNPLFPTHLSNENELIVGTDDAHLDFRISILREAGKIYLSTWVHPNNWMGRVYLAMIMPFHILIVRNAV